MSPSVFVLLLLLMLKEAPFIIAIIIIVLVFFSASGASEVSAFALRCKYRGSQVWTKVPNTLH